MGARGEAALQSSSKVQIVCGDARKVLQDAAAESVDCCVTSPPYFNQRDYEAEGQIGTEKRVYDYIDNILHVLDLVHRVLRLDGTLWLNVGDTYCKDRNHISMGCKPKDMFGVPWLVATALRSRGWYLRQDIIWHKGRPMPSSVKDRCVTAHEYLFLLSKSSDYYFDYEAIKEPAAYAGVKRGSAKNRYAQTSPSLSKVYDERRKRDVWDAAEDSDLRNWLASENPDLLAKYETQRASTSSVWTVQPATAKGQHFAPFPAALIRPAILAGCRPSGTVLDPFAGSGTVGVVAVQEGRRAVLIDTNAGYCELMRNRVAAAEATL